MGERAGCTQSTIRAENAARLQGGAGMKMYFLHWMMLLMALIWLNIQQKGSYDKES